MLLNRKRRKKMAALRHVADSPRGDFEWSPSCDIIALEENRSLASRSQSHDSLYQRRLAHAVTTDERHGSLLKGKVHALQNMAPAVKGMDIFDYQKRMLGHSGTPQVYFLHQYVGADLRRRPFSD